MDKVHLISEIDRGTKSVVYKGREKQKLAYISAIMYSRQHKDEVSHAVSFLHALDHPNVLKFHTWYETKDHLWVLVDYCPGGTLSAILQQDGKLPESCARGFGWDILNGLHHIHSRGCIYGDLKPSNVILNEFGTLKLFDFFLACRVDQNEPILEHTKIGSPYYMAPELFGITPIRSRASDIWAFGCLLYEMVSGHSPYSSQAVLANLVSAVQNEPYPPLVQASPELSHLISACLAKLPQNRIVWNDLLKHPFWVTCKPIVSTPMPPEPQFAKRYEPMLSKASEDSDSVSSSSPATSYHSSLRSLPELSFSVCAGSVRSSANSSQQSEGSE